MNVHSLRLKGVRVVFGPIVALDEIDVTWETGVTALIGPNGSGKTTLLNAISGFVPLARGTIHFDDAPTHRLSAHTRARLGFSRSFQTSKLLEWSALRENVALGVHTAEQDLQALGRGARNEVIDAEVDAILKIIGLRERADDQAGVLSFGERKLIELARVLATRPKLVLLDEPTSGLHPARHATIESMIATLTASGAVVVIAEHDHEFVRLAADRVVVLSNGKIVADDGPAVLNNVGQYFT